jgi:hypothetical protein
MIDPMAEKYYSISPYAYCGNNPVNRIDPNGMDWIEDKKGNVFWYKEINKDNIPEGYKYIGTEYKGVTIKNLSLASDPNQDYYGLSITLSYTDKVKNNNEYNWVQSYTATGGKDDTGKPVNDIGNSQVEKDNAPYYYTNQQLEKRQIHDTDGNTTIEFYDRPYRKGDKSYQWKAELSLVNTQTPQKSIITLQYGFKGGDKKLEIYPIKVVLPSTFQKELIKNIKVK